MRCSNCGTEVPDGSRFCIECGQDLYATNPVSVTPPSGKNKMPFIIGGVCAFAALLVVVLVLVFNGMGGADHSEPVSSTSITQQSSGQSGSVLKSTGDLVVSFDGRGATGGSMSPLLCKSGSTAMVPKCGFTYDGHEFVRWESAQKVTYKPGETITVTEDLELFAVWEAKTCTINFLGGGANGGSVSDIVARYGESISLPSCGYRRDGYEFDCWAADSGTSYRTGDTFYVERDSSFTAQWVQKSSGGTSSSSSTSNKHRYELVKKDITWSDAKAECEAKGGHLVTITSQQEMDTIVSMARNAGLEFVWLGGTTSGGTNGQWITGESFSYSAWCENEPSHYDTDGTPEDCMELWHFKSTDQWSWNDERNNPLENPSSADVMSGCMGYVCEYEN